MDNIQKIGKIEAICLIVIVTVNEIIFNIPNFVIQNSGSSSWITTLLHFAFVLVFFLFISKFFKEIGARDIIDSSEYVGGKTIKWIIGILYILLFIGVSSYVLRYFSNVLELIYFNDTPITFILALFLIAAVFASKHGIKAICHVNLLLFPIIFLSLIVILFSTFKDLVPQRIFPMLGFGIYPTFISGFSNIFTFGSIAYLLFLMPLLKNPEDFKQISIISVIISGIYIFFSILCLTMMFPFAAFSDETLSMYLLTRRITFGKFFQRIDAMFILFWILSILVFISLNINMVNIILKKLINIKNIEELNYSISLVIFSIALSFTSIANMKYILNVYIKYAFIILCIVISFIILLLAYLKHKKEKT